MSNVQLSVQLLYYPVVLCRPRHTVSYHCVLCLLPFTGSLKTSCALHKTADSSSRTSFPGQYKLSMVLVNRTYTGLSHINYPSRVWSLSSEFVVKWTYQRMRRKLFLLTCKEKHSILSFPVILEKRNLDYNSLKQKTQKYFHLRSVTPFQPVPQLQKEVLLQDMYQCFLESVHRTHYWQLLI